MTIVRSGSRLTVVTGEGWRLQYKTQYSVEGGETVLAIKNQFQAARFHLTAHSTSNNKQVLMCSNHVSRGGVWI